MPKKSRVTFCLKRVNLTIIMKRILITGENSYIGTNFEAWARKKYPDEFIIDTIDMKGYSWREKSFEGYDCVFHVAGIAHVDIGEDNKWLEQFYNIVNRDLAIETAKKAKREGVKQFVFMSSMIIYGNADFVKARINKDTPPHPESIYGNSKWEADKGVRELADENFTVTVLRPPMIYGKDSKGNYPRLAYFSRRLWIFPNIKNERSMLFVYNLCEFVCQVIMRNRGGIFFPQNAEYTCTSEMVREIAKITGHKIWISKIFNWVVWTAYHVPGESRAARRLRDLARKAFLNMAYEQDMSVYDFEYRLYDLKTSLEIAEGTNNGDDEKI